MIIVIARTDEFTRFYYASMWWKSRVKLVFRFSLPTNFLFRPMERFHSRDQWPFWSNETKESISINIEFNSERVSLFHQYGRRFFVLAYQHGRWDMWKRTIAACGTTCTGQKALIFVIGIYVSSMIFTYRCSTQPWRKFTSCWSLLSQPTPMMSLVFTHKPPLGNWIPSLGTTCFLNRLLPNAFKFYRDRHSLLLFRERSLLSLTVDAIIANQAFSMQFYALDYVIIGQLLTFWNRLRRSKV